MKFKTAESVTIGHPDKLADFIADSILDKCLSQDPDSRVACEVMLSHNSAFISAEITADADLNCKEIANDAIQQVGYETPRAYYRDIEAQSDDICQAVDGDGELGAGDQGIVYGYAINETLEFMPLAWTLAHRLTERITELCMGPDGKSQVTIAYTDDGRFNHIASILISVQHDEETSIEDIRKIVKEKIIAYCFADYDISKADIIINPSGRFVLGGFKADTGLTGRKLMVDSYGGLAHHGGGAMSGKDPSKVDRSGAYMARYIAKNIVAAGLAEECEVSIAYAIGRAQPTAVNVETFGTNSDKTDELLTEAVKKTFDMTPTGIINKFNLKAVKYADTAARGHFGNYEYPWESMDSSRAILIATMEERRKAECSE